MQFIKSILQNIIGFDGLIILVIGCNIFIVAQMIRRLSKETEDTLRQVIYKPLEDIIANIIPNKEEKRPLDIHKLKEQREREDAWYQLFISITSILPLMGILGTVISLLNINSLEEEIISVNFTSALSSTFWGIVGAIICRGIEGALAPVVDRNRDNFDLLVEKMRQD